jgi:protein TonB
MKEAIDDLLAVRAHDPRGLSRMISWSLAIHAVGLMLLGLAPRLGWMEREPPRNVMIINLGGAVGAKAGPTTIGGRPVDEVEPEPARPKAVPPATQRPDVMTIPEKATPPPKKAPPPPPPKAQPKAPARVTQPPSKGRQVTPGNTRAETGVQGIGTGLQIGGGGAGGQSTALDDFCCRAYLVDVTNRIEANWDPNQPQRGIVKVQFTIGRSGQVSDISVQQGANQFLLAQASRRAFVSLQLPPLPAEYTESSLTLLLTFEYK